MSHAHPSASEPTPNPEELLETVRRGREAWAVLVPWAVAELHRRACIGGQRLSDGLQDIYVDLQGRLDEVLPDLQTVEHLLNYIRAAAANKVRQGGRKQSREHKALAHAKEQRGSDERIRLRSLFSKLCRALQEDDGGRLEDGIETLKDVTDRILVRLHLRFGLSQKVLGYLLHGRYDDSKRTLANKQLVRKRLKPALRRLNAEVVAAIQRRRAK